MKPFDTSFFDVIRDRAGTSSVKYGTPPPGAPADTIPMWVADMDFPSPPAIRKALEDAVTQEVFGYTEVDAAYWELLRAWYLRRMDWRTDVEWYSYIPNVLSGVSAAISALTEPGEQVLICEPVYYPFARIIRRLGRACVVSELLHTGEGYRLDFDDMAAKLKDERCKVLLFCSPHNPVGRVWRRDELERLAELCLRNDVSVISDEIHADLVYAPHRHVPFASVSEETAKRTITVMAPTKTFNLAGLPSAHLIISDVQLRSRVRRACSAAGHAAPNLLSLAASRAAYAEGEAWLEGLLAYLQGNLSALKSAIPRDSAISLGDVEGTYLAWLDCRAMGLDTRGLDGLFLRKAGLWLDNGEMFGRGGEGFMRLNFACPRAILREAVSRLQNAPFSLSRQ